MHVSFIVLIVLAAHFPLQVYGWWVDGLMGWWDDGMMGWWDDGMMGWWLMGWWWWADGLMGQKCPLLAGLPDTPEAHITLVEHQSSTTCDVRLPVSAGHYWAVPLWDELCGVSC
jgi:hypothetical protein